MNDRQESTLEAQKRLLRASDDVILLEDRLDRVEAVLTCGRGPKVVVLDGDGRVISVRTL